MEKERRTRIAGIMLGLCIVAVVGLAPSSAAGTAGTSAEAEPGHCVTIDETGPGVRVDPVSCKKAVEDLVFDPPPSALAGP